MKSFIAKLLQKPSARVLAQNELDDARRHMLTAQTRLDYSKSQVEFYRTVISRLEAMLRAEERL